MYIGRPVQFCGHKLTVIHCCQSLNCMVLNKQNMVEDETGEIVTEEILMLYLQTWILSNKRQGNQWKVGE